MSPRLPRVICFAALLLGACGAAPVTNESAPTPTATAAASDAVRALPEAEQRARAFKAVFGKAEPVAGVDGFSTKAGKLVWQGDRAVLITVTEADEGAGACHACTGSLGIYYLVPDGDGFRVTGKFPEAVVGNGFGVGPTEWSVSDKFGPVPVIYSEAGWMGQGYSCSTFWLTELRPDKPVLVAKVPTFYDDGDTGNEDAKGTLEGKFASIARGKSFTLNLTGFKRFSQTWVRKGDSYVLSGEDQMEKC
ncbi:hypothetical protein OF829_17615 [Sphingomonas sp. LB-2]|uniref:hypothetical protein n=1 Tax=Sphingomonas caeni TaxID=2984949 RepID=UPI00222FCAF9|nr:hypothetical protein [Sphingomonas caeni]MCW3849060.1 hypothetical protein [Sphingomonas caeni]